MKRTLVSKSIAALFLLVFLAFCLSNQNLLLFHITTELFCIFIALSMLLIAINTYQHNSNNFVLFLGISYGFVAFFDFLHILSTKDLNILTYNDLNISMQVWIIARYVECISIFIACLNINNHKNFKINTYIFIYTVVSTIFTLSVFRWHSFPMFYSINSGVSYFIKLSNYILIAINFASVYIVKKHKGFFSEKKYFFIISAIYLIGIYIILFSSYVTPHSPRFIIGHLLKFASFYLLYKGIIEASLKEPYKQLKESEAHYRTLFHYAPDGIMIQRGRKIEFVNPAFVNLLGIDQEIDIIGKSVLDFLPEGFHETVIKRKKLIKQGELIGGHEFPVLRPDNTIVYVEVITTILPIDKESTYLSVIRDITERKANEEYKAKMELEEIALKQKIAYEEMKTEFFTNISHDLKTPLNVILGTIQLMNVVLSESDIYGKTKKYLNITKQNCYRLLKLINNLLDISKLEGNSFDLVLHNHDIVGLIENTTVSIGDYIESKGIELVFDTEIEEKVVACDGDKIERVVLNLLSNAIKFTKPGGNILVNLSETQEEIVVSVKDTGIGMPSSCIPYIFDRYKQVNSNLHKSHQGTGLGLALVKSIVEAHGGSIKVNSHLNEGSEFIFTLANKIINDEGLDKTVSSSYSNIERLSIELSVVYTKIS